MYNLTKKQREALRWIVQKVREEILPEEFIIIQSRAGIDFLGVDNIDLSNAPPLSKGVLDALEASGLILVDQTSDSVWSVTLLGKAYEAVDSNFDEEGDMSNIPLIADDIFTRTRSKVDQRIGELIPNAIQKFTAVSENLQSVNPEDWANAVHSCRRILQDLADVIFPSVDEGRIVKKDGKEITIKLGKENYINRIVAFVQNKSDSERFEEIVGSNLRYLGDRLDSTFRAAQKGSHENIMSRDEADRYVVYTYLLVGDILSLYTRE